MIFDENAFKIFYNSGICQQVFKIKCSRINENSFTHSCSNFHQHENSSQIIAKLLLGCFEEFQVQRISKDALVPRKCFYKLDMVQK